MDKYIVRLKNRGDTEWKYSNKSVIFDLKKIKERNWFDNFIMSAEDAEELWKMFCMSKEDYEVEALALVVMENCYGSVFEREVLRYREF